VSSSDDELDRLRRQTFSRAATRGRADASAWAVSKGVDQDTAQGWFTDLDAQQADRDAARAGMKRKASVTGEGR
jgi:hypothetical protein